VLWTLGVRKLEMEGSWVYRRVFWMVTGRVEALVVH
jgi:hypothetical protein